jgi:hypothetical protein
MVKGRVDNKRTRKFQDLWGWKPQGNTHHTEPSTLMRSDAAKIELFVFSTASSVWPWRILRHVQGTSEEPLRHPNHLRDERSRAANGAARVQGCLNNKRTRNLKAFEDGNPKETHDTLS